MYFCFLFFSSPVELHDLFQTSTYLLNSTFMWNSYLSTTSQMYTTCNNKFLGITRVVTSLHTEGCEFVNHETHPWIKMVSVMTQRRFYVTSTHVLLCVSTRKSVWSTFRSLYLHSMGSFISYRWSGLVSISGPFGISPDIPRYLRYRYPTRYRSNMS